MDSPHRSELEVVLQAIQAATAISLDVLHSLQQPPSPTSTTTAATTTTSPLHITKPDLSPVTVADLAIQTLLLTVLSSLFPTHAFIAEESSAELRASPALLTRVLDLVRLHGSQNPLCAPSTATLDPPAVLALLDRAATPSPSPTDPNTPTFIIDPIDGTQAFLRGHHFAINVALVTGAVQTLGVVSLPLLSPALAVRGPDPLTDELVSPPGTGTVLFAVRSHGAFLLPLSSPTAAPVRLPTLTPPPASALRSVTATPSKVASANPALHAAVSSRLGAAYPSVDLTGWVPRWCALALGLGDVCVWVYSKRERFGKVWDHAGAMLIFEEVGGVVTDVDGKGIDVGGGRRTMGANFGFVAAAGGALHAEVLGAVRDAMREEGLGGWLDRGEGGGSP
ncbi:3',5'-bisphosphate nucleotidase [Podospora conica]|nr:3',5'-bisphosphate nucleotidase [Schizothecium conicum]